MGNLHRKHLMELMEVSYQTPEFHAEGSLRMGWSLGLCVKPQRWSLETCSLIFVAMKFKWKHGLSDWTSNVKVTVICMAWGFMTLRIGKSMLHCFVSAAWLICILWLQLSHYAFQVIPTVQGQAETTQVFHYDVKHRHWSTIFRGWTWQVDHHEIQVN